MMSSKVASSFCADTRNGVKRTMEKNFFSNRSVTVGTECARPRAQQRSITDRIAYFQHLQDVLTCCARGRAHSAVAATRHRWPNTLFTSFFKSDAWQISGNPLGRLKGS